MMREFRKHAFIPQRLPAPGVGPCGHRAAFAMTAQDAGGHLGSGCALCLLEDFIESDRCERERAERYQRALLQAVGEIEHAPSFREIRQVNLAARLRRDGDLPPIEDA